MNEPKTNKHKRKTNKHEYIDPAGCPQLVTWQEREMHEEHCSYATLQCPNSPKVKKKQKERQE